MRRAKAGTILIASFWILAILSILAIGIGFRVSLELRLSKYAIDRTKALYLARAGVVRCQELLKKDAADPTTSTYDSMRECGMTLSGTEPASIFTDVKLSDGTFSIGYEYKIEDEVYHHAGMSDEERKININAINDDGKLYILRNLLGIGRDAIASAILDWRDQDDIDTHGTPLDPMPNGAENSYYEILTPPYKCKNENFAAVEELLLVKDMTPEIFKEIKDYVTIYGNDAFKVNVNTAPKTVLTAIGLRPETADRIIDYRNGSDDIDGTKDDIPFANTNEVTNAMVSEGYELLPAENTVITNFFTTQSNFFRIESKGVVDKSKIAKTIVCVVKRGENKLISYREY